MSGQSLMALRSFCSWTRHAGRDPVPPFLTEPALMSIEACDFQRLVAVFDVLLRPRYLYSVD
ncbi:MAG: hypothetical protein ACK2T2_14600 [Anaerolineales bacterium]